MKTETELSNEIIKFIFQCTRRKVDPKEVINRRINFLESLIDKQRKEYIFGIGKDNWREGIKEKIEHAIIERRVLDYVLNIIISVDINYLPI